MKRLLMLCVCLCLIAAIIPAVSAATQVYPSSVEWAYTSGTEVSSVDNAFDGTNETSAEWSTGSYASAIQMTFPPGTELGFCQVYSTQPSNDYIYISDAFTPSANYLSSSPVTIAFQATYNATCGDPGTGARCPKNGTMYVGFNFRYLSIGEIRCYATTTAPLTADFNATPVFGQAPLYVSFQDNSTGGLGGTLSYNWSVSPDTGVIGEESTSEYPTIAFTLNGNYSVTHCVSDIAGSDCETKTDYISVYNSTATAITTFWAVDPLGHRVYDSAISLQDVENASWTNASSPSGGVATITSLIGHTINGYATASGYSNGQTLGITADGVTGGVILMTPTNITNVSAGYVTLYVYAKEAVGNAPIPGAFINIAYAEGGSTRNDGGTTSAEGIASFTVPNKTLIYVYGEKAGYDKVSTTKDTGNGSGGDASVSTIIYMSRQTVTTAPTPTTLPGGGTPTTAVTTDPRTSAEKQTDMANILVDYGDELVMFFIMLTLIGGVKLIAK